MASSPKRPDRLAKGAARMSDEAAVVPRSRASWRGTGVADHFVQFYSDDSMLIDAAAGFLGEGLQTVEGAIVIATEKHREGLEEKLGLQGIDVAALRARKQYVPLDARDTLNRFMVNGLPDALLFAHVVGSVITRMVSSGYRVRAFGEMVGLLWTDGNSEAAIQLEHLWNDLGKTRRFALFCACPMAEFEGANAAQFRRICSAHESFIPVEGAAGA
jgi:DcmR-like sensory protein